MLAEAQLAVCILHNHLGQSIVLAHERIGVGDMFYYKIPGL